MLTVIRERRKARKNEGARGLELVESSERRLMTQFDRANAEQ